MTNKIVLVTVDQFMADYKPVYQPFYPLLLGKSQQYDQKVGKVNFRRAEAVGDIRAKAITPKDTEFAQVQVGSGSKVFKKHFFGNQFIQSTLQVEEGNQDVVAQVLDEHHKQADELLLFGEGTSSANVVNNGLIFSGDSNHIVNAAGGNVADLNDLHARIIAAALTADQLPGRKVVVFYGSTITAKVNSIYATQPVAFRKILSDSLPAGTAIVQMPSDVAPVGNGVLILNLDQLKLHYTTLPKLDDQGVNSEKKYVWYNFLMGSMMVEVLAKKAVIHQPLTWA